MKINIRQFKKWIAALDSGEYEQGQYKLQFEKKYCCLGVGCKITIPRNLLSFDEVGNIEGGLPQDQPAAPQWLREINSDFRLKTGQDLLSLNDTYGFIFPEIATLLELVYTHKILD